MMKTLRMRRLLFAVSAFSLSASAHAQIAGQFTPVPMASLAAQVAPLIAKQNFAGVAIDSATVNGAMLSNTLTGMQSGISGNASGLAN